jgi:hypothetical protein
VANIVSYTSTNSRADNAEANKQPNCQPHGDANVSFPDAKSFSKTNNRFAVMSRRLNEAFG